MNTLPDAVRLVDISKRYDKTRVLEGCTLTVPSGTVMGVLGKNGAGKTTLLKIALGLVRPDGGEAKLLGEPAWELSAAAKQRLGYVPQIPQFFAWMRVRDVIDYVGSFYEHWSAGLIGRLVERWEIPLDSRIGPLSPGEQQKVAIVLGLAHEPDLLVLDEPAAALDPAARREFLAELVEIAAAPHRTIIFSTHITSDLERVADSVAVLRKRRVAYAGELGALKDQVKRLHITGRHALPPQLDVPGALRQQVEGSEALVSVCPCSPELIESLESQHNAAVEVEDLNLEDIFLELHHG